MSKYKYKWNRTCNNSAFILLGRSAIKLSLADKIARFLISESPHLEKAVTSFSSNDRESFNTEHAGRCFMDTSGKVTIQPAHYQKKLSEGARYLYEFYEE